MSGIIVSAPCGKIRGYESEKASEIAVFKGIRYATAGRFEYPKLVEKFDCDVYDAKEYGACSWQRRAIVDESKVPDLDFWYKEFREGIDYTYSDDCFFLNIWTPVSAITALGEVAGMAGKTDSESTGKSSDKKLPVMFYIHGGSFADCSSNELTYEGEAWAKKGVITVFINYRLGPFGFMCLPELLERDGFTGNYALFDQNTALKWVLNNIESFGGDKNNITLMGQSAGAMSVQQHCNSGLSKNLFQKAIMISGGGVSPFLNYGAKKADKYFKFYEQVMKGAGASNLEELLKTSPEKIMESYLHCKETMKNVEFKNFPMQDGRLLKESAISSCRKKTMKKCPYILSITKDDIYPPLFRAAMKRLLRVQTRLGNKDVYFAEFNRELPGSDKGAFHSCDLWYCLGTMKNCWRPFTDGDYDLSERIVEYYTNFAKSGNPNVCGDGGSAEGEKRAELKEWKSAKEAGYFTFDVENGK